jgi:hypothetical protein
LAEQIERDFGFLSFTGAKTDLRVKFIQKLNLQLAAFEKAI